MLSKNRNLKRIMLAATLIMMLALSVAVIPGTLAQETTTTSATTTMPANSIADIYTKVSPSVVAIAVEKVASNTAVLPGFGQQQTPQPERGLGSGFVLDTNGYILTNDHVVDGATSIEVDFNDGTLVRAKVIGTDPDSDIAVIQVDGVSADKLHPVNFAAANSLYVGEPVLAIGSPFGERWTLTTGIVSGIDRVIQGLTDYSIGGVIQTDAAINPGNSGGPLLDMNGDVVGINAQIVSPSGSNAGVGFAIPGSLAQRVASQLIDQGYVEYSYLGIAGGDVTLSAIEALNLPNDTRGVLVADVTSGGPADRAGLQAAVTTGEGSDTTLKSADIITAINGEPLYGIADLISYLARNTQPGNDATLTVLRNGTDEMSVNVHLIPRPHTATQN